MHKRKLILFIILAFLVGITAGTAIAAGENVEITALLSHDMGIKLNGKEYVPLDEDGTRLYPILYGGRSYLPVRALANAVSVAAGFDDNTRTILLGENDRVSLTGEDFEKMYTCQFTTEKNLLLVNDKQYDSGIVYTGTAGSYEYSGFVYPKGAYQKFGGVACFQDNDGSTSEVIIKIRENDYQGKVLKEIVLHSGESIAFEIDIPQVKTLYIQNLTTDRVPKSTNPDILMMAEPYFK